MQRGRAGHRTDYWTTYLHICNFANIEKGVLDVAFTQFETGQSSSHRASWAHVHARASIYPQWELPRAIWASSKHQRYSRYSFSSFLYNVKHIEHASSQRAVGVLDGNVKLIDHQRLTWKDRTQWKKPAADNLKNCESTSRGLSDGSGIINQFRISPFWPRGGVAGSRHDHSVKKLGVWGFMF